MRRLHIVLLLTLLLNATLLAAPFTTKYCTSEPPATNTLTFGSYIEKILTPPDPSSFVKVTMASSHKEADLKHIVSSSKKNWNTGEKQKPGMWLTLSFDKAIKIQKLELDSSATQHEYARSYEVYISDDGQNWGKAKTRGKGKLGEKQIITLDSTTKAVKIVLAGRKDKNKAQSESLNGFH